MEKHVGVLMSITVGTAINMRSLNQDRRKQMKRVRVADDVRLIGVKNFSGRVKLVDYYLQVPNQSNIYAFSKIYTNNSYDLCKAGIRVNDLISRRTRDTGVMRVVKYTNLLLPYFVEEYALPLAQ